MNTPGNSLIRKSGKVVRSTFALCSLFGLLALLGSESTARSQPRKKIGSPGKVLSKDATIFARDRILPKVRENLRWQILKQGEVLPRNKLLLGLPGAEFSSNTGAVKLTFLTDLTGKSPYPVIESAVIPHLLKRGTDFSFTLDRGRVLLTNTKKEGEATVNLQFADQSWTLSLKQPGDQVGVELFGRYPPGAKFTPGPGSKTEPVRQVVLLMLKGKMTMKCSSHLCLMSAPPGPAIQMWDSVHGMDRSPTFLKGLPEWAKPDSNSDAVKKKLARIEQFRQLVLEEKNVISAVRKILASDDKERRQKAPVIAGAFDALDILAETLEASNDIQVWENAVIALRHWLGRGPRQDQILYQLMIRHPKKKMLPAHAQTLIQLLHGFDEETQNNPILYDGLIHLLTHDRLGIRGLAAWHLHHLAIAPDIPFNPLADAKEQEKIQQAWRKLIPDGKLPPEPKTEEGSKSE